VDTETGEFSEKTLAHERNKVREFYTALENAVALEMETPTTGDGYDPRLACLALAIRIAWPEPRTDPGPNSTRPFPRSD
jgi:hypothetical protein